MKKKCHVGRCRCKQSERRNKAPGKNRKWRRCQGMQPVYAGSFRLRVRG